MCPRPYGYSRRECVREPALGIKIDLGVVEGASGKAVGKIDVSNLNRKLYDARGEYRGELTGPVGTTTARIKSCKAIPTPLRAANCGRLGAGFGRAFSASLIRRNGTGHGRDAITLTPFRALSAR
jgi:hypothetical protein